MTQLSTVPIHLAELPKPGWFLSWCLSSRFAWIRNEARAYRNEQVFCFRHKERQAIEEALFIERRVKESLEFNGSIIAIKSQIVQLENSNKKLVEEIRTYPEVQKILKATYTDLLNRLSKARFIADCSRYVIAGYSRVFVKSSPRAPRVEVGNLWDAVEVNYTPRFRKRS